MTSTPSCRGGPSSTEPLDVSLPDLSGLRGIVNERWLDAAALTAVGAKGSALRAPIVLDGFLEDNFAISLAYGTREARSWRRFAFAYTGAAGAIQVPDAVWADTPGAIARYTVLDEPAELVAAGPLNPESRRAYRRWFSAALVSRDLQRWYQSLLGVPIGHRISIEVNRLQTHDELRPHQDLHQGRIVNSCIYLDVERSRTDGGVFGFSIDGDGSVLLEPRFNRLIVIPLGPHYWHWVEPYQARRSGRECIAVGVHRPEADPSGEGPGVDNDERTG